MEQNITCNSPDISQVSTIHQWLIQLRVWKSESVLRYRCLVDPIVTSAPSGLNKLYRRHLFTCFYFRFLDNSIKWLHIRCICYVASVVRVVQRVKQRSLSWWGVEEEETLTDAVQRKSALRILRGTFVSAGGVSRTWTETRVKSHSLGSQKVEWRHFDQLITTRSRSASTC